MVVLLIKSALWVALVIVISVAVLLTARYLVDEAMVAVTEQVPAPVFVRVEPLTVQFPAVTA